MARALEPRYGTNAPSRHARVLPARLAMSGSLANGPVGRPSRIGSRVERGGHCRNLRGLTGLRWHYLKLDGATMKQTDAERLDKLAEAYSTNADYCRHLGGVKLRRSPRACNCPRSMVTASSRRQAVSC